MGQIQKIHPRLTDLASKVGLFIEYWGFKQVHGKIWTLMFLSKSPIDANHIIETLEVSKALVSMSLKDLLHYNVILEIEKEKPGTQKYAINPDITRVILDVLQNRELSMLMETQKSFEDLQKSVDNKEDVGVDEQRMAELGIMVHTAITLLNALSSGSEVDLKVFEDVLSVQQTS